MIGWLWIAHHELIIHWQRRRIFAYKTSSQSKLHTSKKIFLHLYTPVFFNPIFVGYDSFILGKWPFEDRKIFSSTLMWFWFLYNIFHSWFHHSSHVKTRCFLTWFSGFESLIMRWTLSIDIGERNLPIKRVNPRFFNTRRLRFALHDSFMVKKWSRKFTDPLLYGILYISRNYYFFLWIYPFWENVLNHCLTIAWSWANY